MLPPISRRSLFAAALAAVLAGCTRAARKTAATSTPTPAGSAAVSLTPTNSTSAPASPTSSVVASASPQHTGPATEIARSSSGRPEIALTFHGDGDPAIAIQILQILQAHSASISVLAVGTWLQANPDMAKRILDGGHELGNHTWSHPTLIDLGAAATQTEIVRCRDLLVAQTGSIGGHFRQSGSQNSSALIRQLAGAAGYPVCLSYDVDSLDWTDPGAAAVRRNVAAAKAGSIVSMHLGHPGTVQALPGVLDDLAARALTPVTATRLLS